MITGMYQTTVGTHNHRSSRGSEIHLEPQYKLILQYFKEAGYYVVNADESMKKNGKTDYNFVFDYDQLYEKPDLSNRKEGQPFFAQVHLHGGKFRHGKDWKKKAKKQLEKPVTADQVSLPPYYPDHPAVRDDWADYLNTVQYTDIEVGHIIDKLKAEGLMVRSVPFLVKKPSTMHCINRRVVV